MMAVAVIEKADSELSRVVLEDGEVISIATIQLNLTSLLCSHFVTFGRCGRGERCHLPITRVAR